MATQSTRLEKVTSFLSSHRNVILTAAAATTAIVGTAATVYYLNQTSSSSSSGGNGTGGASTGEKKKKRKTKAKKSGGNGGATPKSGSAGGEERTGPEELAELEEDGELACCFVLEPSGWFRYLEGKGLEWELRLETEVGVRRELRSLSDGIVASELQTLGWIFITD